MRKLLLFLFLLPGLVALHAESPQADTIRALVPTGMSVYRHGYREQTDAMKAIYDQTLQDLLGWEANNYSPNMYHRCDLPNVPNTWSYQDVMHLLMRMYNDIPELYCLSSTIPRYDYTNYNYYARMSIVLTPSVYLHELQHIYAIADTLLAGITPGMSDYEKLKVIHDAYIDWGNYGGMSDAWAGTIRLALLSHKAVCEGNARAGLFLCQQAGLNCIYVGGQLCTSTTDDTWGNHAWNYVQVDGRWYLMDLTTDGAFPGVCGYSAFLKGQSYFQTNYRLTSTDGSDPNLSGIYTALPTLATADYDPNTSPTGVKETQEHRNIENQKILCGGRLYLRHNSSLYDLNGRKLK